MKHTFQWILVAVVLYAASNVQVMADGGEGDDVNIPILIGSGDKLDGSIDRSIISLPFFVCYQGGTIYISSSAELSSIDINVRNMLTGQVWSTTIDITDGMGEICIANGGAGSYTLEIVTEYGDRFTGNFRL